MYYFCTRFYNQRIRIIINYLNYFVMDGKIVIPCEICYGLVFTTIYSVKAKRKKDGKIVPLGFYLNKEDADSVVKWFKENRFKIYSLVFSCSKSLWL